MASSTATIRRSSPVAGRPPLRVLPGGADGMGLACPSRSPEVAGAGRSSLARPQAHEASAHRSAVGDSSPGRSAVGGGRGHRHPAGARGVSPVPVRRIQESRGAVRGSSLRLTRRGRLVVRCGVLILALLGVLVAVLIASRPAVAGAQSGPVRVQYHVVMPGETLWGIAGRVDPHADRRDTIARIVELNALPDSGVEVGERIALPPPS